jgi:hypothetical protein
MEIKRKIQIGAAAVVANGLMALAALQPRAALAVSCTDRGICGCGYTLANCQAIAPPGCTATSLVCALNYSCGFASMSPFTICRYS